MNRTDLALNLIVAFENTLILFEPAGYIINQLQ